MIHVNVRQHPEHKSDYIVETSTDGAGWKVQYVCTYTIGDGRDSAKNEAEEVARIFANGCRYAGANVRATSCGYAL